jgi:hypothetical protein
MTNGVSDATKVGNKVESCCGWECLFCLSPKGVEVLLVIVVLSVMSAKLFYQGFGIFQR